MRNVQMQDAVQLASIINNRFSLVAATEALVVRDRWVLENYIGALNMSDDVRFFLENAPVPRIKSLR